MAHHAVELLGRAGEDHNGLAVFHKAAAGCGAAGILEHHGALGHVSLLQRIVRHLLTRFTVTGANHFGGDDVLLHGQIESFGNTLAGDIIHGGSKTACDQDDVAS